MNKVFLLILLLVGCTSSQVKISERKPSTDFSGSPDYPRIFEQARNVLKLDSPDARRSAKDLAETPIINMLEKDPTLISADKQGLAQAVEQESKDVTDLTKHLRLIPPSGRSGYSNLKFFATHPYYFDSKLVPADNVVEVWRFFLAQAKKQIILNVFDFDLQVIADTLASKAKEGVQVTVGIDKNTIATRPEVDKIYAFLTLSGVHVVKVNSVSLNHQKMAAIDWENLDGAKVLFSSGNLTQSCLGPEGDLVDIPAAKRPKESIPNANHVITMDSWLLANLVNHELTKTLDPSFAYRGAQYPTTGSYQVTGPGVDPNTLEAYPEDSLVITFSPGGAARNINQNIIAHFIKNSTGPIRMLQFAYSSDLVSKALLERAVHDYQEYDSFDFRSVGDTPFAVQFWSQFLKMSGLDLATGENKKKSYTSLPTNEWTQKLSPAQLSNLRKLVRIAPSIYGTHTSKIDGKSYAITSKIHHKILSTGPFAIVGTSFNFSEAAEDNNEQIIVFKNKNLVKFVNGLTTWLYDQSPKSVYQEAMDRNLRGVTDTDSSPGTGEDKMEKRAAQLPGPVVAPMESAR